MGCRDGGLPEQSICLFSPIPRFAHPPTFYVPGPDRLAHLDELASAGYVWRSAFGVERVDAMIGQLIVK